MGRYVRDIMNPELFALPQGAKRDEALAAILGFGITAAPVVDDAGRPIGITSMRDLVEDGRTQVSTPAVSIPANASIDEAAQLMAESGHHHLVVVGSDGRVVGIVSSLDIVRALVGLPPKRPAAFPHRDPELGVAWTDAAVLDAPHATSAPEGPGVLVISAGGVRRAEIDLWAEPVANLRARVTDLVELPQDEPLLARILTRRDLRFRCAAVADARTRDSVAARLRARIEAAPLPREEALGA